MQFFSVRLQFQFMLVLVFVSHFVKNCFWFVFFESWGWARTQVSADSEYLCLLERQAMIRRFNRQTCRLPKSRPKLSTSKTNKPRLRNRFKSRTLKKETLTSNAFLNKEKQKKNYVPKGLIKQKEEKKSFIVFQTVKKHNFEIMQHHFAATSLWRNFHFLFFHTQ